MYKNTMMNSCRTCLTELNDQAMDFSQLPKDLKESKSYSDVMLFCLSIEIPSNCEKYARLCAICYNKIIDYYNFKLLALNSDKYWRSLDEDKNTIVSSSDIKCENLSDIDHDDSQIHLKEEIFVKNESDSDNELLSVIKKIKYEYIEDIKESDNETKKVQNRRKKIKTKTKKHSGSEQRSTVCDKCGKTVKNIQDHMVSHTSLEERKKIKCKLCDRVFNTIGGRNAHYRSRHLGIRRHCDICSKDVVCLKSHLQVVHKTLPMPFKCVLCEQGFISRTHLDTHMLKHTKHKPFKCDQPDCEKAFYSKRNLFLHKRGFHDKERSHLCQFCSKGFFKKSHLLIHLQTHSKEKNYKCDECGNYYKTRQTLRYHKETHLPTKNYPCELCDNTFVNIKYLRVHMLSHTKERRYPCKYCGVKFIRSDHRLRHQRTAHEKHMNNEGAEH